MSIVFNPFTPEFKADPYPHYAEMRRLAPVHKHPLGFWVLSGYDDVYALLRSNSSVQQGKVAPGAFRKTYEQAGVPAEPRQKGLGMLDRDPPDHTRLRKLVAKVFTPRAIAAMEAQIQELVDDALDDIAAAGGGDLVDALAFPLPFTVVERMLGMPPADNAQIRALTGVLMRSVEPVTGPDVLQSVVSADAELAELVASAVRWKRRNPGDDLLTALIAAEEDGDVLTGEELVAQVTLLYVAGHETTVNLISGGILALLRHPDQLARWRDDPSLDENAVDELLRYDAPVHISRRVTVEPYKVGDEVIPEGSFVMAHLAAANRDETFFGPDAESVRLDRPNARKHLSFGSGIHYCLGGALARMEGRIAIGDLIRRFPGLRLDGDVEWNGRVSLRGPARLPVRL
jgi:cytochrome P450